MLYSYHNHLHVIFYWFDHCNIENFLFKIYEIEMVLCDGFPFTSLIWNIHPPNDEPIIYTDT